MLTLASVSFSSDQIINAVVWLVVAGIIFWLCTWLIDYCKVPEPFNRVAKVLVALVAVVILIKVLLSFTGTHF